MVPDHLAFLDQLSGRLEAAAAARRLAALLLVRLPCIPHVDGLLGHRAGDDIARQAARAIEGMLRPGDGVWRLDRATLACVLTALAQPAQAWSAAHRMVQLLAGPMTVAGHRVHAMPSVGFALFPTHAAGADALLQCATLAAEAAPHARDHVAIHDPARHAAREEELALQSSLLQAIADQRLELRFQPQLRLADGLIVACEALSRWQDERLGSVPPARFVPALETAGWMPRLTHWLLHASLRQLAALDAPLTLAVNLSAQDMAAADLPLLVQQALATWNVPPARLVLEITETAMMQDDATLEANLHALQELGVGLSLDDFGTGHSSLARLKRLPIRELKIDTAFVRDVLASARDRHIVRSVIELGHGLGLTVVAEGVEDAATLEGLAQAGCDLAQGYHIAPPLAAPELGALVAARRPGGGAP